MIVDKHTNPERDIYYLGSMVIELLSETEETSFDYINIYQELKSRIEISFKLYILTLDWLFLLGTISKGKNGTLEKCF